MASHAQYFIFTSLIAVFGFLAVLDAAYASAAQRCWDRPRVSGEGLRIKEPVAVYNKSADEWIVALTCGTLTSAGRPLLRVIWTTPSGTEVPSSFYGAGDFHLYLANPVSGGTYTCHMPQHSPAATCLPYGSSLLLQKAHTYIDREDIRMLLFEARLKALGNSPTPLSHIQMLEKQEAAKRFQQELSALRKQHESLAAENARLKERLVKLRQRLETVKETDRNILERLATLEESEDDPFAKLSSRVASLEQWANRRKVSFDVIPYVPGGGVSHYNTNQTVIFGTRFVHDNTGGALNHETGIFTAPVSGKYFFTASSVPREPSRYMDLRIKAGTEFGYMCRITNAEAWKMAACQTVVHLDAGDTAYVYAGWNSDTDFRYTSFAGFLLAEDYPLVQSD